MPRSRHQYPPKKINKPTPAPFDGSCGVPAMVKLAGLLGQREARTQAMPHRRNDVSHKGNPDE